MYCYPKEWATLADKELKGRGLASLDWAAPEGLTVKTHYTAADLEGIEASTGSACTPGSLEPSHVLLAMGADEARARGSRRFSLGATSSAADVGALGAVIGLVAGLLPAIRAARLNVLGAIAYE